MTRPLPDHGTRARYHRGCRCNDCTNANYRYCKAERLHIQRQGHGRRLDPAPIQARIRYWENLGYSHGQIAAAAGVNRRNIDAHAKGQLRTINPSTAAKILAARLGTHDIPDYLPVDATGTIRRLRALVAIGHPVAAIAHASGHTKGAISKILNGHGAHVRGTTAASITNLYRTWSHQPGTSARARNLAARNGWHGPIAWDGNIDDPAAQPELDTPAPEPSRLETARARREEVLHLARFGTSPEEIAARTGLSAGRVREQLQDAYRQPATQTA